MHGGTTLTIPPDHPALPGHFPGDPIIPGVLLLDEALRAIELATGTSLAGVQIGAVKFLSVARPGEPLYLEYELSAEGGVRFVFKSEGRLIVSGAFTLAAASHGVPGAV